jgi:hypothetical protein
MGVAGWLGWLGVTVTVFCFGKYNTPDKQNGH